MQIRESSASDEEALVLRAKRLEEEAWSEIFQRHFSSIYAYIRRRVESVSVAEDLAAQVFLEGLERIGGFTYRGVPLVAWLFRIAHNMVVSHYRRQAADAGQQSREAQADIASPVEETVDLEFLREELVEAMSTLTDDQRQVVMLRFLEGLSTREVAAVLDKPAGAVKALQHRALASMKRFLTGRISNE